MKFTEITPISLLFLGFFSYSAPNPSSIYIEEQIINEDATVEAAPNQQSFAPKTTFIGKSSADDYDSFDGTDWEADSGKRDLKPLQIGNNHGYTARFIGFESKWGEDRVDLYTVWLNEGSYIFEVGMPVYNSGKSIQVQLYDINDNRIGSGGNVSYYYSTYSASLGIPEGGARIYLKVDYEGAIDTNPVKYRVLVDESPYAFLSPQEQFKQLTEDLGGNYYYLPEIKNGDTAAYEEALNNAFKDIFKAADVTIESVTGALLAGQNNAVSVTIADTEWASSDTLKLVSDDDGVAYPATVTSGLGTKTLRTSVAMPSAASTGCYSVSAVIGGASAIVPCALKITPFSGGENPASIP
ncbi:hypothetical protein [Ostreibacterium oceani]|uniref:Uncharacterized protein n=1 Tax=Ostreibacterium oceani TaxID=2654998 RepID=A0A6N7F0N7_9GAMM|nr:hypothetical protein [Ostreibacterium oceani]MPV85416.1 hypothetical protein [Ostreibacterium oceani]